MTLIECPQKGHKHWRHKHQVGSHSHHYCLLVMQVLALSTEKPMGTKEPLPDNHFARMNVQVIWRAVREAIIERDGEICTMCGNRGHHFDELEVHHIIPRSQDGSDHPHNLVTLCKRCHHGRVHGGPKLLRVLTGEQATLEDYPRVSS